jgi:hypothetical protein
MAVDNGSGIAKQRLRAEECRELGQDARVLEMFTGEGYLYRSLWHRWRGLTIDMDEAKVKAASKERPMWACYKADSLRAVRGGIAASVPFDVVDMDAYGAPWKFLRAWMLSERTRADRTLIFLTDGYSNRPINVDRALFGSDYEGQVTSAMVREAVPRRLEEWGAEHGIDARIRRTVRSRRMLLHVVEAACR